MATYTNIDELVHSVTLFIPRPLFLHGYVLPFIVLYASWIYGWIFVYDSSEYYEAGFIGISVIALCQLLCGLFCHWSVHVQCFFSCNRVKNALDAEVVKVVPTPNNGRSELVRLHKSKRDGDNSRHIWFIFQKTKYIWDENKNTFRGVEFPVQYNFGKYMEWKGYQDDNDLQAAEMIYGKNQMDMVVPEFMELFKERATAPFFVFQLLCVALWCLDKYVLFSFLTLAMLVLFECTLVQQQLKNMAEIRNMGNKPYFIQVYRHRKWRPILSDQLIPGDIVSIVRSQNENLVPCDMLLLRGTCVVDESMLTGESVPQMKEPVENANLSTNLDIESNGKLYVLFGGTKVLQHIPPSKVSGGLKAQDSGCVAYVLRNSFNTSQGKLLRTILFGVKRVTANNLETFAFILFLLIFAITAAIYVWVKGCEDPNRNRYKLFLECALILTSVVPPELPVELSLAVNASLASLSKLDVFCTEPFRIPFAGKVDICCFDKTGTLTSDDFVVEGLAGLPDSDTKLTPISKCPENSIKVLATCHSLAQLDDGIIGDPLEKATLKAVNCTLTKADSIISKTGKLPAMKIVHRYHFSSELKRMSVLAGYAPSVGEYLMKYFAAVKGAPETLKGMLTHIPENYDETYLEMTRRGARVLALGWKNLGSVSSQDIREMTREKLETDLEFAGFIVLSSPLKYDSKIVIKEILNSSHCVVMITGDNPLTACHVAKELKFVSKDFVLLIKEKKMNKWMWESINGDFKYSINEHSYEEIITKFSLCITGEGLTYLMKEDKEYFYKILPHLAVFARVAPKQKEQIILALKSLGYCTVMCGDGTNDVGALKHADVGVAILSNAPETKIRVKVRPPPNNPPPRTTNRSWDNDRVQRLLSEIDEQRSQILKLGDASIAAPFTSKLSSVQCICHIIKQGRCTLVTTLQMFKILALNALITAYSQSVLYLNGIKFSDYQAALQGLLLSACFLFITRSKPLKTLSKQRPLPNIFNLYIVSTVLLQFLVHFVSLIFMVEQATLKSPKEESVNLMGETNNTTNKVKLSFEEDEDSVFVPNLVNSTVLILSIAFQVSTFAVNYRGHPFMESLWENKPFLYSILVTAGTVFFLTLGLFPDLSQWFEIVEFTPEFRWILVQVLVADFIFSYILDRSCLWLLGEGKVKLKR